MLPLTVGFLVAGPVSGYLSDRFGARPFATGGMLVAALSFLLLELLPVNFSYPEFAAILFLNGAGMSATFQNSSMVLSIGIFFRLIILGLSSSPTGHLFTGLTAQGVPAADATGSRTCRRRRSCSPPCSATTRSRCCSARCSRSTRPATRPT